MLGQLFLNEVGQGRAGNRVLSYSSELFNDTDKDFPANAKFLYQKHAEYYLDPESLGMTGIYLAERLKEKASL